MPACLPSETREVAVPRSHGSRAALVGHGSRVVVFSNASDADLCQWLPFAEQVARSGFQVVLYDYKVARIVRKVTAPTLFVTSRRDPYGAYRATRHFTTIIGSTQSRLMVAPGSEHGASLLADPRVRSTVRMFLDSH